MTPVHNPPAVSITDLSTSCGRSYTYTLQMLKPIVVSNKNVDDMVESNRS